MLKRSCAISIFLFILCHEVTWAQDPPEVSKSEAAWAVVARLSRTFDSLGPYHCRVVETTTVAQDPASKSPGAGKEQVYTTTHLIWHKGPYERKEKDSSVPPPTLVITHPDAEFWYDHETDAYVRHPSRSHPEVSEHLAWKFRQEMGAQLALLGAETVDGQEATVVEMSMGSVSWRGWLSNKTGQMLRYVFPGPKGQGRVVTVTEWRGCVFEELSDNLFKVPEDKVREGSPSLER